MKWTIATVTFRYHLHSYREIIRFAEECGSDGLELWEPHWLRHRSDIRQFASAFPIHAMSAYLDLTDFSLLGWKQRLLDKLDACRELGIPVLRLFSGTLSSSLAVERDWEQWFRRIEGINRVAEPYGVQVAFETHPGTLLDRAAGVDRFCQAISRNGWQQIGINFDAYHVWEFGVNPQSVLDEWHPYIRHVHVKNAAIRTKQFAMSNVYHPSGCFDELRPLGEGQVCIRTVMEGLCRYRYKDAVTLEWFGLPDGTLLKSEIQFLRELTANYKQEVS
ncbi:sugar phosphate isomerase/epimerase family protein [Xylanibacillus composti]|uniref:Xylose isomerase-like TIM barrel domain-containing protein n=1 Tax=Xylanibacillus composti TaxID=1572762 RepID=A0A8J4H5H4_9BACL|nr:sugar phosphate isomerase/epimerase family protein [Xylanibacillus composti]GIQ68868.1 hypothetical protein XYCOK13_16920 [Xylanibacillus composti]